MSDQHHPLNPAVLAARISRVEAYINTEVEGLIAHLNRDSEGEGMVLTQQIADWVKGADQIKDMISGPSAHFESVALFNRLFGNLPMSVDSEEYWPNLEKQLQLIESENKEMTDGIADRDYTEVRDGLCDILVTAFGYISRAGGVYSGTLEEVSLQMISQERVAAVSENVSEDYWYSVETYSKSVTKSLESLSAAIAERNAPLAIQTAKLVSLHAYRMQHACVYTGLEDMEEVCASNMSKFCDSIERAEATVEKYKALNVEVEIRELEGYYAMVSTKEQTGTDGVHWPEGKLVKGIDYRKPVLA